MDEPLIPSEIRIFDQVSQQFMDLFQIVLLAAAEDTHIPEIYEIFGPEYTLRFLDIFRGMTVEVPSREVIANALRDVGIYLAVVQAGEGTKAQIIRDLAVKHGLTAQKVRSIYYRTTEQLSRFKVEHDGA